MEQPMEPLAEHDPRQLGPYTVLGRLGAGSMGEVFLGRSGAGRQVALKLVHPGLAGDPDFQKRFAQEVRAARAVSSPRTVDVLDADTSARRPWMATTYVEGPTLLAQVAGSGPLAAPEVLALAQGLAEALAAIHAAGLIHRDLKPSNVILSPGGPMVIDFGIVKAAEASTMTVAGRVSGSAGYMSPEQAEGRPLRPASDLFSFGAVLYYAATGEPPFGSGQDSAVVYRLVHGQADAGRLPEAVRGLVLACLAKQEEQRPSLADVLEIVAGRRPAPASVLSASAGPDGAEDQPTIIRAAAASAEAGPRTRRVPRGGWLVGAAGAALLVAVAGVSAWGPGLGSRDGDADPVAAPTRAVTTIASASASPAGTAPAAQTGTGSASPSGLAPASGHGPGSSAGPASGGSSAGAGQAVPVSPPRRTSSPVTAAPAPKPKPTTPKPTSTAGPSRQDCLNASTSGSLEITTGANSGGPNYVPDVCTAIYLRLTDVTYITYARACIETGTTTCGSWVYLEDKGAWNTLATGVKPGTKYRLDMKSDGSEHVGFLFSNQ